MATFSEIIGGITKDLVQVQVSSDLSSMDAISHYKNSEILKNLDIPRFRLSNINMNLKFAISEDVEVEQTDSSVKYVESEWVKILYSDVLEEPFKKLSPTDKKKVITYISSSTNDTINPNLDFNKVLKNESGETVSKSTDYLMNVIKKLPDDVQSKLPKATELKKVIKDKVQSSYNENLSQLKKVGASKAAIERDLSVIVEKSALENINSDMIHEISFTIEPDFIKFASEE